MAETAPTPEETRWASFIMNEQRHKRPVTPEDRKSAGEIMGRARRVSGRTGGGASHKPKASPLVVARAIKDIDAKVAEAQGINASREGDVVPAPEKPIGTPIPTAEDVGQAVERHRERTVVERLPTAEEAFQTSGIRLIEDMDRALEALRQEHTALMNRASDAQAKITALGNRRAAILAAIDAFNEVGR